MPKEKKISKENAVGTTIGGDTTGDGKIDTIKKDTTGDGKIDTVLRDLDGDGVADIKVRDTTGDGQFDCAQTMDKKDSMADFYNQMDANDRRAASRKLLIAFLDSFAMVVLVLTLVVLQIHLISEGKSTPAFEVFTTVFFTSEVSLKLWASA